MAVNSRASMKTTKSSTIKTKSLATFGSSRAAFFGHQRTAKIGMAFRLLTSPLTWKPMERNKRSSAVSPAPTFVQPRFPGLLQWSSPNPARQGALRDKAAQRP